MDRYIRNPHALRWTDIVFAEIGASKIGLLDPATNQILEWPVPIGSGADHLRAAGNMVYFTQEAASDNVGLLDSSTNVITEWQIPTAGASADNIDALRPGLFVFTEFGANKIGLLDTTAEVGVDTISSVPAGSVCFAERSEDEGPAPRVVLWFSWVNHL